ncbi:TlpA family protein disulfide reductase [Algoriphagus litoralis]|uniref:TlpA family protein disulfide reductase n=1 Tax=Algoriphagus litoralis TaxID=2202829 RepID=UPI000DB95A4B|nr:TlpA disulfide reductase family protein [Algoriphagus litoralis]
MYQIIFAFLILSSFEFKDPLQKAREKFDNASSISFHQTGYYPIPDVDIVDSSMMSVVIFNPGNSEFQFIARRGNVDEVLQNGVFSEVRHAEKSYYRYESTENQKAYLESSILNKYSPHSLLKRDWEYLSDTVLENATHSHFSRMENSFEYEGKNIVATQHIFISSDDLITRFERRNRVDGVLTQTVTYTYKGYGFDQESFPPNVSNPERYALKYFERMDKLKALEVGAQVPVFSGLDTKGNEVSLGSLPKGQTLILFGSISCGYSQLVIDHISQSNFGLKKGVDMVTFLGSDTKENAVKYLERYPLAIPVIADRRDIETAYGVAGYPILYLVDQKGVVLESLAGSEGIIELLDSLTLEK